MKFSLALLISGDKMVRRDHNRRVETAMGIWGTKAWENDAALDWYERLMLESDFVDLIDQALALDAQEHFEEIRGAASLLWMLNAPGIWPLGFYESLIEQAENKLQEVLTSGIYDNPEMITEVEQELKKLQTIQQQLTIDPPMLEKPPQP